MYFILVFCYYKSFYYSLGDEFIDNFIKIVSFYINFWKTLNYMFEFFIERFRIWVCSVISKSLSFYILSKISVYNDYMHIMLFSSFNFIEESLRSSNFKDLRLLP